MEKNEAEFQTRFSRWLRHQNLPSAAFELKVSKTNSIPFSCTEEQQVPSLLGVKHGRLSYKIPDMDRTIKPFDFFQIVNGEAYMVVMFNYSLKQKQFVMIDVDQWVAEEERSVRKSLTFERAVEIGTLCELA
jgi:hypothetical protein